MGVFGAVELDYRRISYNLLKAKGFIIYSGKLTVVESFRVGCIGRMDEHVIRRLVAAARDALTEMTACGRTGRACQAGDLTCFSYGSKVVSATPTRCPQPSSTGYDHDPRRYQNRRFLGCPCHRSCVRSAPGFSLDSGAHAAFAAIDSEDLRGRNGTRQLPEPLDHDGDLFLDNGSGPFDTANLMCTSSIHNDGATGAMTGKGKCVMTAEDGTQIYAI